MGLVRSILWFEPGELSAILVKIRTPKPAYEGNWEAEVLSALVLGAVFAFIGSLWAGLLYTFLAKAAVQALNKKRFFDPLP